MGTKRARVAREQLKKLFEHMQAVWQTSDRHTIREHLSEFASELEELVVGYEMKVRDTPVAERSLSPHSSSIRPCVEYLDELRNEEPYAFRSGLFYLVPLYNQVLHDLCLSHKELLEIHNRQLSRRSA